MYWRTTAPFFCSTKQLSFFLWSRERVKGTGQAGLRSQSVMTRLINSPPLSLWNSLSGKGRPEWMSLRAVKVQRRALLRRENREIQPEATSVAVRVRIYRPEAVCPQWWRTKVCRCQSG